MVDAEQAARELAAAILRRADWTDHTLADLLRSVLEQARREVILACCRATCMDCAQADPERVEEDGGWYYLHRPEGLELFIECRSSDIRSALLEAGTDTPCPPRSSDTTG